MLSQLPVSHSTRSLGVKFVFLRYYYKGHTIAKPAYNVIPNDLTIFCFNRFSISLLQHTKYSTVPFQYSYELKEKLPWLHF